MAVTVELRRYRGLPQVIKKNTDFIMDRTGTFNQPYSLMNPTLNIEMGGNALKGYLIDGYANYVKIDDKYYFIVDWKVMPNNYIEISLHLDVLTTYQDIIGELYVWLERSSTSPNKDVQDGMLPLSMNKEYVTVDFPRGFSEDESKGTYILVAAQSGYTVVDGNTGG